MWTGDAGGEYGLDIDCSSKIVIDIRLENCFHSLIAILIVIFSVVRDGIEVTVGDEVVEVPF